MLNKQKIFKILFYFSLILLIVLAISPFFIESALARPGGGNSYSGGGGGGSGGGGGDGIASLIIYLIMMLPPEISIPLVIIVLIIYVISKRKAQKNPTITSTPTFENRSANIAGTQMSLDSFRQSDPNFSKVLFLEFVSSLFHKFYNLQNSNDYSTITPFVNDNIIQALKNQKVKRQVNEIVIGSLYISNISQMQDIVAITVDLEANYTVTINNNATRYVVTERWLLNRKSGVVSKDPETMRKLSCPNCGAASDFTDAGQCNHCQTFITKGDMQWFMKDRKVIFQQAFQTNSLLTYAEEVGTNYPTVYQANIQSKVQQFEKLHNTQWSTYWSNFQTNVANLYFTQIYSAWTRQRWDEVRHLVADRLWESNQYWQETYKKASLINKLENINISKIDLAKIETDKFYEAVTVRIFANCFDYVTDRSGKVMAGTNKKSRYFSEYWTFIRHSGVEKDSFDLKTCPSCGAPADKMGQAGNCEYCGSKISTGQFSWVLAIITQDEAYRG